MSNANNSSTQTGTQQGAQVIDLGAAKQRRQDMGIAEEDLLAIYEREMQNNPKGFFNQHTMEDGSTRITATVPPGVDPGQFLLDRIAEIDSLNSMF